MTVASLKRLPLVCSQRSCAALVVVDVGRGRGLGDHAGRAGLLTLATILARELEAVAIGDFPVELGEQQVLLEWIGDRAVVRPQFVGQPARDSERVAVGVQQLRGRTELGVVNSLPS